MVADVVQPGFENLQHLFAGDAAALEGALVDTAELPLHQAIIVTKLLLFDEAKPVIGVLAAGLGAMNARAIVAALQVLSGAKNRDAKTTADANARTSIT